MSAFAKSRRIAFLAVLTLLLAICLPVSGVAEEAAPVFDLPPARGAVDWSGVEEFSAPEVAPSFQLQADQSRPAQAEAGSPVLDKALGVVGLPGMSAASDDESTYEKAWRMSDSPSGGTRLTYGERYRRNPDGSYGAQSSSQWSGVNNVADRMLEQALSAGSGYFSSWAEGWLGGFGKARISVRVNDEGDVTGSGDFLYPIYDSEYTTFFTQIGLRTMTNDRVIGNFGLGQRFFPAENFALGYNVFIDQDFSRNHTRGGAGIEAWYDWVRLSANYYTPLSGWKDSEDYDSRLVEERPAEGYDARLTGYLPFYRNLAVTGAFEKWKGDHVGSFGNDDVVQKDPKIWSYGLEWTPVPAFSTSVNQRHSGGQKETQFGLTFNYHFGMDWEDQLSSATVTEMRTVDGSRHDFVNRQNEMILAYRAKDGAYNMVLWRTLGHNTFEFRLTNGFGESVVGQSVGVSAAQNVTVGSGGVFTTDGDGVIQVTLDKVPGTVTLPLLVTLTAGRTSRTIALNSGVMATDVYTLEADAVNLLNGTPTNVTFTVLKNNQPLTSAVTVVFDPSSIANYSGLPPSSPTDASGVLGPISLTAQTSGASVPITATIDGQAVSCAMGVSDVYVVTVTGAPTITAPAFNNNQSVAPITVSVTKNSAVADNDTKVLITPGTVVDSAAAIVASRKNLGYGFQWTDSSGWAAGATALTPALDKNSFSVSGGAGQLTTYLTDVIGQRTIALTLCVTEDGTTCLTGSNEPSVTVSFGDDGPLKGFSGPPKTSPDTYQWADAYPIGNANSFPAATACGGGGSVNKANFPTSGSPSNANWSGPYYDNDSWDYYHATGSNLPKATELQAVSGHHASYNPNGKGAALAAGWPVVSYWTGEVTAYPVFAGNYARLVNLVNGFAAYIDRLDRSDPVVCRP